MTQMNFQVLGIDPTNKGAGLMLAAIRQEVQTRFPGARVGVDVAMPFEERLRQGVWGVTPEDWEDGSPVQKLKGVLSKKIKGQRLRMGLLHTSEIDVILDASGFAYGDFWGAPKMERQIGRYIDRWKAAGKTVIALPQAWGAFTTPGFDGRLKHVLGKMDLVFARDKQSLGYLQEAGVANATLAPDFTNLLHPTLPREYESLRGAGFIVPNSKMLEAYGDDARGGYLEFLIKGVASLRQITPDVQILVHEGHKDMALATELNTHLDTALPIVDPQDPVVTKAILGVGSALISSRFHGLVSALSAGVPSMACGWSHKYQELLNDYSSGAHVIRIDAPDSWDGALADFVRDAKDPAFRTTLAEAAATEKDRARAVWDTVDATLAKRG